MTEIIALITSLGPVIGVILSILGIAHLAAKAIKQRQERHLAMVKLLGEARDHIGRLWHQVESEELRSGIAKGTFLNREYFAIEADLKRLRLREMRPHVSFWNATHAHHMRLQRFTTLLNGHAESLDRIIAEFRNMRQAR